MTTMSNRSVIALFLGTSAIILVAGVALQASGSGLADLLGINGVVFGATFTGAGMADDIQKGIIDRFRSLPMARSAVLIGRTTADVGYNVVTLVVMAVTGVIVGWRIRTDVFHAIGAFLLLLAFAYAISWVMALIGLLVPSPEVVNNASFIVIFPMTFIANTFVSTNNFPTVLKVIANWNPVSTVTQAARQLFGNTGTAPLPTHPWPLHHAVIYTLFWVVGILIVFVPLSIRQYHRAAAR